MRVLCLAITLIFAAAASVRADDPVVLTGAKPCYPYAYPDCCPPSTLPPVTPGAPGTPGEMKAPGDANAPPAAAPDQLAGATEAGTQPAASFNPNMFGDLIGVSGTRRITFPSVQGATPMSRPVRGIPVGGQYNGFTITDDESPRPVDRVFFSYNNYANVGASQLGPGVGSINVNREMIGFEKTFLSGDASVGLRLPFIQINGFSDVDQQIVGDLTIVTKFAWINDRQTGNVFSTGLAVTVPTGGGGTVVLADNTTSPHAALFQPWGGWIYNWNKAFFQGFTSVVVPSDPRDPAILFNSAAAGYWAYRSETDRFLRGFAPVVELYVNTPLNHSNPNSVIFFENQVNVTTGAYVVLPRMTVGGAVCVPLAGPRPYNIEAIASMNFNF